MVSNKSGLSKQKVKFQIYTFPTYRISILTFRIITTIYTSILIRIFFTNVALSWIEKNLTDHSCWNPRSLPIENFYIFMHYIHFLLKFPPRLWLHPFYNCIKSESPPPPFHEDLRQEPRQTVLKFGWCTTLVLNFPSSTKEYFAFSLITALFCRALLATLPFWESIVVNSFLCSKSTQIC